MLRAFITVKLGTISHKKGSSWILNAKSNYHSKIGDLSHEKGSNSILNTRSIYHSKIGDHFPQKKGAAGGSTKNFTVSGSLIKDGPWVILAEDRLAYYSGSKPATLRELKFDEAVEVQFLKFDLVSYWGRGGGLQYFAAILTTGIIVRL